MLALEHEAAETDDFAEEGDGLFVLESEELDDESDGVEGVHHDLELLLVLLADCRPHDV